MFSDSVAQLLLPILAGAELHIPASSRCCRGRMASTSAPERRTADN